MLSPLCYLSEGFSDQHRLKAQVEEVIDRMVHDIGKFGMLPTPPRGRLLTIT